MSYCPDPHNALFPAPPTSLGVMPGKVQMSLEILCLSPTLTRTRSLREPVEASHTPNFPLPQEAKKQGTERQGYTQRYIQGTEILKLYNNKFQIQDELVGSLTPEPEILATASPVTQVSPTSRTSPMPISPTKVPIGSSPEIVSERHGFLGAKHMERRGLAR